MMKKVTLEKMQSMGLGGMLAALEQQRRSPEHARLEFEDRLGLLVDGEWEARENRKLTNRLRQARMRYAASIEDVDYSPRRGLDRKVVLSLATCQWLRERQSLIITGATGTGKSWLACAFVERACRSGFSALYVRTNRLLYDLAVARGDGSYRRLLVKLAKLDLLALDDWLLNPLEERSHTRRRSRASTRP